VFNCLGLLNTNERYCYFVEGLYKFKEVHEDIVFSVMEKDMTPKQGESLKYRVEQINNSIMH
jgi:hypothetical protein